MQQENSQPTQTDVLDPGGQPISTLSASTSTPVLSCVNPFYESNVAFDNLNSHFYHIENAMLNITSSNNQPLSQGTRAIIYSQDGQKVQEIDLSTLFCQSSNSSLSQDHVANLVHQQVSVDQVSEESDAKKQASTQQLGDTWSILRFIKGKSSKGIDISPSGFSVKINRTQESKHPKENNDLILTNMAFTSGLHLWEIIATISCNNLHIGVFNPLTKKDYMTSFKTTTPRIITICLDLNENQLKFWLNDRRNPNKTIKLPEGGPWIPCIKLEKEKNKIILNPFAREPSDYYERDFDKKFNVTKYVIPHLHNMLCVTKLPQMSTQTKEAAIQLREHLKLASFKISQIILPHEIDGEPIPDNEMFCFIQFHHYDSLVEFTQNNKDGKFSVYQFQEIASWFTQESVAQELKGPYGLIKSHINLPKSTLEDTLKAIDQAYQKIIIQKDAQANEINSISTSFTLTQQTFSDKIICIKDQQQIKSIARDSSKLEFDIQGANFSDAPNQINSEVCLKVKINLIVYLFKKINWTQILKNATEQVYGIVSQFFNALLMHRQASGEYLMFKVPLNIAKFFIEFSLQQTRAQLDRIRRNQNNYQTVISVSSPIQRKQNEQELDQLRAYSFFEPHTQSIEDLSMLKQILVDLNEQLWAQSRSPQCGQEVKALLNQVSRPFSALNRLGSFIGWSLGSISPQDLADNGFFFRENLTISQFENQLIEIADLSQHNLTDSELLQEVLGKSNRYLKSLVTENIPIHRSLNYLPSQNFFNVPIVDVIPSQNSEFVLIGSASGNIHICNSQLNLTSVKCFNFFSDEIKKKPNKYAEIEEKIQFKKEMFDNYKEQVLRKSVPLGIIKDMRLTKIDEEQDQLPQQTAAQTAIDSKKGALMKKAKQKANKKKIPAPKILDPSKHFPSKKLPKPKKQPPAKKVEAKKEDKKEEEPLEEKEVEIKPILDNDSTTSINKRQSRIENWAKLYQVLGYILLSKPATSNFIDPLIVGCVFFNLKTRKYFLKIRKVIFSLVYLQQYIGLDSHTGQQINRLSGKQIVDTTDFQKLYQEILNQRDVIVDLNSLFVRNQIYKDYWPRKDQKFQIFSDIFETEIELPFTSIIDFSKTSYSITNQNQLYFLVETLNESREKVQRLVQYHIIEEDSYITYVKTFRIQQGKYMDFDNSPQRVLQFDKKILLINSVSYQVLDQENFRIEKEISFAQPLSSEQLQRATILNETDSDNIFNKQNLKKYLDADNIDNQEWILAIIQNGQKSQRLKLKENTVKKEEIKESELKSQKVENFELKNCQPSDILQLGNLLNSKYQGTIPKENQFSYLTSSCQDSFNKLYTHHSWHILPNQQDQSFKFDITIPKSQQQNHVRQLDFEFSFKRLSSAQIPTIIHQNQSLLSQQQENQVITQQQESSQANKNLIHIPLIVDYLVGAQINDFMQPCFLTCPDSQVFSSNYSQPELIFKHQHNKLFVATQFIVRSKENKEWNGVPISQGVIFTSETLEDLMNTKQFSRFTEKEYTQWKQKRGESKEIPLQFNEPVAYFDLGSNNEITITLDVQRPCRYIKFIPTAFRKKPINFSSKPFNSNQAECQFFGVNGYEVQQQLRGVSQRDTTHLEKLQNIQELQIQIDSFVEESRLGKIGEIQAVMISEFRGAKCQSMFLPTTILQELNQPYLIGVAKASVILKEEHCDKISSFSLVLPQIEKNQKWEIQGVSVSVKSFIDQSVIFQESQLQHNKSKLRHYLLDPSHFNNLLLQLIEIAQDDESQEEMRNACLKAITQFLRNLGKEKSYQDFYKEFRKNTQVEKLINSKFIYLSQSLQQSIQRFLDDINILENKRDVIYDFINSCIDKLLVRVLQIENIENVLKFIQFCKPEERTKINTKLSKLLTEQICNDQLPHHQSSAYIILRSKFGLNSFPLDEIKEQTSPQTKDNFKVFQKQSQKTIDGYLHLLDSSFEIYKMNTLYHYNIDLNKQSIVEKIKLYFEHDNRSLYKILIRIIVPDEKGDEQIIFKRVYDENIFTQLCDIAHMQSNIEYFNSNVITDGQKQQSNIAVSDQVDLNCLTLELSGYVGRFLKLQIELLDTYRSVHKQVPYTQIFIRPEFFGSQLEQKEQSSFAENDHFDNISAKYKKFLIAKGEPNILLGQKTFNSIPYSLYIIPNSTLSHLHKSCLFEMQSTQISLIQTNKDKDDNENLKNLMYSQLELRQILKDYKKRRSGANSQLEFQIKRKVIEINKILDQVDIQQQVNNEDKGEQDLSLKYLLQLSDSISKHLVNEINQNMIQPKQLSDDIRKTYLNFFKHFTVYDHKDSNLSINKLMDKLFLEIQDKSQFVVEIFKEFLSKPSHLYSQKNIVGFIQNMQPLMINDVVQAFIDLFNINDDKLVKLANLQNQDDLIQVLIQIDNLQKVVELQNNEKNIKKANQAIKISFQQFISVLNILDDLKIEQLTQKINLGLILRLFCGFIIYYPQSKMSEEKRNLIFTYALSVLQKYATYKDAQLVEALEENQIDIILIIKKVIQLNNKQSEKSLKKILIELSKQDKTGSLISAFSYLQKWYQNKENIKYSAYYRDLEEQKSGKGTGQFFKHLSIVFKFYMKLIQRQTSSVVAQDCAGSQQIQDAYKSLKLSDVLQVLIVDKDSENYEENYGVVWIQIYESLSYLDTHTLIELKIFQELAQMFFSLSRILQESLYPKLHHKSEKMIELSTDKNPQIILQIIKAFLIQGFANKDNIKIAYCFCDGLFNIIQSGKKDLQDQTKCLTPFNNQTIDELFTILSNFLTQELNLGVFNGIKASQVQTIMRLDLAIQMTSILQQAKTSDNQGAFIQYVKSEQLQSAIIQQFIDWIFINYSGQKGKNSPAGSRSYQLSISLEQLLSQFSECDKVVSLALPILMKQVLFSDQKLRDLSKENKINSERSVQIQKNVNQLFLNLFKQWVKNDSVAKQFLMELNGFDFLLDRLFSKQEQQQKVDSNIVETDEYFNSPKRYVQDKFQDSSSSSEEQNSDDDQIFDLVKHKILKLPLQEEIDPKEEENKLMNQQKTLLDKKSSFTLSVKAPSMKKQTAEVFEDFQKQASIDPNQPELIKNVEQNLQVEDYARAMKVIWSSDKQKTVSSMYVNLQWNKFKNGSKNKIYNVQITEPAHSYEYVVQFDLETVIQINEIQVGVLYNWSSYDPDLQYVPQTFIVEGGKNKDEPDWKVELTPVDDDGYKLNTITVFGYNFIERDLKTQGTLNEILQSIGCKECQYLTFKLRKPLMACLDSSMYVGSTTKVKSYCFSYISVMGTKAVNQPIYQYLLDIQKENSLEILSKFFSGEFIEAFEIISEQPAIIEKIKNAFDKLSILLDSKASLIKPIFLAICQKNKGLGDWIMLNRLISLDEKMIKKEQIKFLGDIISTSRERQLEKLSKLKEFIIVEINSIVNREVFRNNEQKNLLSRFIRLYSKKMREYSNYLVGLQANEDQLRRSSQEGNELIPFLESGIVLEFQAQDLENAVSLMSQCENAKSQLVNSLISFNLLLLMPPKPFLNQTISIDEYVEKLLSTTLESNQLQNLLFSSIIASTNESAFDKILHHNKIDWIINKLKYSDNLESNEAYQQAQVIYNCSKQNKFKDKFRSSMTFEFYNLLKNPASDVEGDKKTPLLKSKLSSEIIELIVQIIKDIVIGGDEEEEKLSIMLKEDMIKASDRGDVDFINQVIVPILHAEEKIPISLSIYDLKKRESQLIQPIFSGGESQQKGQSFFLKTDILNNKQKQTFSKMFKELSSDKIDNFSKLVDSRWDLIYEDKNLSQDSSKFRKFVQSVQNKQNIILLAHCNLNGAKAVFGGFSSKPFPCLGETWAHEFDYQIPYSEGNFVFYYTEEKELHFTMLHNKPFGYIYTDYEEGGALSVSGDFFLISWSYEFQNSCGNIYDMKCVEEPSIMTFYSNMEVVGYEVWYCNVGAKAQLDDGKVKSELKKNQGFKSFNPHNFFRENLIFEVNKEMTLSQVAKEILGQSHVFVKYPSLENINDDTKLSELKQQEEEKNSILDLLILKKDTPVEEETKQPEEKQTITENKPHKKSDFGQIMLPPPPQFNVAGPWTQLQPAAYSIGSIGSPIPSFSPFQPSQISISKSKPIAHKQSLQTTYTKQTDEEQIGASKIPAFIPSQPILKRFEEKGGIFDLIKAAKAAIKLYKSDKLKEMWSLWLAEIESFSQLPTFFQTFCQDREKETIIYNLLEGKYDVNTQDTTNIAEQTRMMTQFEELHIEMVKYSYKIVNQVFEKHEGAELRDQCLKNGTLERFIERVGQLSSEKKRVKIDRQNAMNILSESENTSPIKDNKEDESINQIQDKKKKKHKDSSAQDDNNKQKRKGVGYTTGVGTTWNVNEYLKSKDAKNAQISNIVNIIKHFIRTKDWEAPPEIKILLLESALLPTVEAAFRSGSLLEMAKDFDLNMAYLELVSEVAKHPNLIEILLDIGEDYEPRQKDSIKGLLEKLSGLSKIFLGCLTSDSKTASEQQPDEQTDKPKRLAEKIEETFKVVQEKVKEQIQIKQQQTIEEMLSMPLQDAYLKLLSQLRFDYMTMKDNLGMYQHSYQNELVKNMSPTSSKLVRLAQEIADLSNSLPCDHTNAIFCRVDKERVDLMKCLIMGASGTPYAHGSFIYDLFFENSYPQTPPKCQLVTTGGQTVRFNPNLYHNGKVCLSLLGTWRGSATENWDPKLSTILQVLLSIQAIIMSNEVYFNEPGYEHEAGTPEGEKKNEGYSNIIRYCNIKYAIIDMIKNPPAGFEKIIKRNYYLKKNEILREVKEWVDRSKTTEALYTGLVYDHNYQWAPQISQDHKYQEMMDQIYKELKEVLEGLQSPFEDENTGLKIERQFSKNMEEEEKKEQEAAAKDKSEKDKTKDDGAQGSKVADLNEVDVSYEPMTSQIVSNQGINIDDDKVKDRWSRYIGAMGIEAVAKQAESRILICNLGPLGSEIAKNIVLAGCKELILYDSQKATNRNCEGHFLISKEDLQNNEQGKLRGELCRDKLQQLNFYVKVSALDNNTDIEKYLESNQDIKVVVITESRQFDKEALFLINKRTRQIGGAFIMANQVGLFGQIFNDFGESFVVLDKNGEELSEIMIESITNEEDGLVTLLQGFKHSFEDGDQVQIRNVKGMLKDNCLSESINGTTHSVKVVNPQQFRIGSTLEYSKYESLGFAKQIRVPKKLTFKTLEETFKKNENIPYDQNMLIADFEKMSNAQYAHQCFKAMLEFSLQEGFTYNAENYLKKGDVFVEKYLETPKDLQEEQIKSLHHLARVFAFTSDGHLPAISAYMGGIVAQEIVKAITQKYTPINQLMYIDAIELFPLKGRMPTLEEIQDKFMVDDGYKYLRDCLGPEVVDSIQKCKLFMIGAGAIGCELLKNYAMLGLGVLHEGQIILTDPDVIEISNLNRQFLFREKHLRKPKSQTAAAAAIQMNSQLKGHISARLDKIHEGTSHIYNESFFKSMDVVTNALDNVQARLYIDNKCVSARRPLIDSGTLGPKGHVQVIIPFKTESYSSQRDPEDHNEIPHCTLKMFPEETLHCVELAKDIFGNQFALNPQSFNKLIYEEADKEVNFYDQQELILVKKIIKLIQKQPKSFEDCLLRAREKFQKYFYNDIKQLLHVYPLDKLNKDGRPFWSLPKRPPVPIEFDPRIHQTFISSTACLLAKIYKIQIPYDNPRSTEAKQDMADKAILFEMALFTPNDQKAAHIEQQVDKQNQKENLEQEQENSSIQEPNKNDIEEIKKKYFEHIKPKKSKKDQNSKMEVEEFEKDNDENFHIDFIYAMANIRAANYGLDPMDWLTVKIKAGKIVPALATTTAAIAGLQTLELIKLLKQSEMKDMRNSFLNLSVPSLMMSEPGNPAKTQLKDGLEVTLWDRWMVDATPYVKLREVIEEVEQNGLKSRDVFYGTVPILIHAFHQSNKQKLLDTTILELIGKSESDHLDFVDLTITFVDPSKGDQQIIEGVPSVRVSFNSQELLDNY